MLPNTALPTLCAQSLDPPISGPACPPLLLLEALSCGHSTFQPMLTPESPLPIVASLSLITVECLVPEVNQGPATPS